eukprot:2015966-Heterocapsa_arctica.AAC.1
MQSALRWLGDERRGPPTFGGLPLEEAIPLWFPGAENWDTAWFMTKRDLKGERLSEADWLRLAGGD